MRREDLTGPGLGGNKAPAALAPLERRGAFEGEEAIVFLHTGGQPALFTDWYATEVLKRGSEG